MTTAPDRATMRRIGETTGGLIPGRLKTGECSPDEQQADFTDQDLLHKIVGLAEGKGSFHIRNFVFEQPLSTQFTAMACVSSPMDQDNPVKYEGYFSLETPDGILTVAHNQAGSGLAYHGLTWEPHEGPVCHIWADDLYTGPLNARLPSQAHDLSAMLVYLHDQAARAQSQPFTPVPAVQLLTYEQAA